MSAFERTAISDERPPVVFLGASRERLALAAAALSGTARVVQDREKELGPDAQTRAKIVLVDLEGDRERGLRTVEEVQRTTPEARVVAVADGKDPEVILRAMRAGACEFAVLRDARELEGVVEKLLRQAASEGQRGTILAVFPAKGGVGATTLAVNLACELCRLNKRVLIADFGRQLDALAFLDMAARQSLVDVAKNLHRFDRELLLASLAQHPAGPYVAVQPNSLEDGEMLAASQATALLQLAARHFDYVVCDGLRDLDELSVAVLDAAHRIELVLTQDIVALKNARRTLELFHRLGYGPEKVELVVNRFHAGADIDPAAIAEHTGLAVRATIAQDEEAALAALNRGVPAKAAAPRSKLVRDITAFGQHLAGSRPEKRRGLLGALFRRSNEAPADQPSLKEGVEYDVPRRSSETA